MPWTGCVTWPQECPSCAHRPWGVGKLTLLLYHVKISAQTGYLYSVGSPLQCSCLENPRDRGSWWAAVYGVTQSRTRLKRLSSSSSNSMGENLSWETGVFLRSQDFESDKAWQQMACSLINSSNFSFFCNLGWRYTLLGLPWRLSEIIYLKLFNTVSTTV